MIKWYENNRRLFREERENLASSHDLLGFRVVHSGFRVNSQIELTEECVIVNGVYELHIPDSCKKIDYRIVILLPNDYPKTIPVMYCNDPKLPMGKIDRHIMQDGSACLGVQVELGIKWRKNPSIVTFLDNLVAPFLAWQTYFDVFQKPPWIDRSHLNSGILEAYEDLVGPFSPRKLIGFIRLLARKNKPKGHEVCPCGSGEKLRNCHIDLIYKVWCEVSWQDVKHDLVIMVWKI